MKNVILALLLLTGISYASAQDVYTSSGKPGYHKKITKKKKGYDPDKLIFGGGLQASFGGGYASAGLSPIVGYRITDHFSAGIGLGYLYYQEPRYVDPQDPLKVSYAKENIIYPSLWARYFVFRNFFVTSTFEYDFINVKVPGYVNGYLSTVKMNVTNPCLLMGAGFRQPLGGRVSLFIEVVYDFLQGQYSPYPPNQPDIRLGFAVGL